MRPVIGRVLTSGPAAATLPAGRDLDGKEPRRVHHFSTATTGRHSIADVLTLVGAVRRLAFDRNLPPAEALGRIRDAYRDYDEGVMRPTKPPTAAPGLGDLGAVYALCEALRAVPTSRNDTPQRQDRPERLRHLRPDGASAPTCLRGRHRGANQFGCLRDRARGCRSTGTRSA